MDYRALGGAGGGGARGGGSTNGRGGDASGGGGYQLGDSSCILGSGVICQMRNKALKGSSDGDEGLLGEDRQEGKER
ncbi:unnamed protein product [Ilex paraguariensis]|uniref:Uncharacterized protein n=1 Tax=Ilex paraguariensis TaxID=185542 RepID=A0ABC8SAA3_9AQUA